MTANIGDIVGTNGINTVKMFEKQWIDWNVNDLVSWLKYNFAKMKNRDYNCNSSLYNDQKMNDKYINDIVEPNWNKISKNLSTLKFEAQDVLPNMGSGLLKYF